MDLGWVVIIGMVLLFLDRWGQRHAEAYARAKAEREFTQ